MKRYLYIAACAEDGGVYRYEMKAGIPSFVDKLPCDRPMFLATEGNSMHILLRAPFADSEDSGVITCSILADGRLFAPSAPISTQGVVGCHIAVGDGDIYVANYVSGSVARLGGALISHQGRGPHPTRQTAPHAHGVLLTPDGKYLLVTDLGIDTVFVYDRALREVSHAKVPTGHGCRHMAITRDGRTLYVVNELGSSITVFSLVDGRLTVGKTMSTLLPENEGRLASIAAAVRLSADERALYVTNRGENTVAHFAIENGALVHVASYPTEGEEPRDLLLFDDGHTAAVTNQFSNDVLFYAVQANGALTPKAHLSIPAPLCLLER